MISTFSKKSAWWSLPAIVLFISINALALTGPAVKSQNSTLTINIENSGTAVINGQSIELKSLAATLKKNSRVDENTAFLIETNEATTHASVHKVSRQLLTAGFSKVQYKNHKTGKLHEAQLSKDFFNRVTSNSFERFEKEGKWGYIDKNGEVVIDAIYDEVSQIFVNGLAGVKVEQLWGKIDSLGNVVIPIKYKELGHLEGGRILFEENGKKGFLDEKGGILLPAVFDDAHFFFNDYAPVQLEGKWGFIKLDGEMAVEPRFENIQGFMDGLAPVQFNGRWGFVDGQDELVIPCQYNGVNPFQQGLASVKVGDKWGFINKANELVIEPQFDDADLFYDSRAVVKIGNKYGVIDQKGEMIIEPEFGIIINYSLGACSAITFENKEKGTPPQQQFFDVAGNPLASGW